MGDWLAGGRVSVQAILSPISRMDLDKMQTQGLPVDWFDPDQLERRCLHRGGRWRRGANQPRAPSLTPPRWRSIGCCHAKDRSPIRESLPWATKAPTRYASIFPKIKFPGEIAARPGQMKASYPVVDRAEWMDQEPIRKFVKEVLEQRTKVILR